MTIENLVNNMDPSIPKEKVYDIIIKCNNRINTSYYKYGPAKENFHSGRVDAAKTAELCLEKFFKTRNTEYLLDVINYCVFGFLWPLPGDYFKETDSSESAGTVGTPINLEKNI